MELENWSKNFSLNQKEMESRVKSTIVLFGIAILILFSINFSNQSEKYVDQLSLPLCLILLIFLFCITISFALSRIKLNISFVSGKLKFPYYYFWLSEVSLTQICGLEELRMNGEVVTLIIFLESGDVVYFDKNIFTNKLQFYEFREQLSVLVGFNIESSKNAKLIISEKHTFHNILLFSIVLIWVSAFFLISSNSVQEMELVLEKGAISRKFVLDGEFYRLFSSFFLHSNLLHIATNVLVFTVLSQFLVKLVDVYRYINILFISAFFASIITLLAHQEEFVIGASGGVFGLFGAFCAIKTTEKLSGSVGNLSGAFVVFLIFIEVLFGWLNERTDFYSHLGGFVSGFLISKMFLIKGSSKLIHSSACFEKFVSIVLIAFFLGGFFRFFLRVYFQSG
tara:strand:+ start:1447 stop:2634 length:1188 start_codon:yes stop_codon:yes gene_type:complete